MTYTTKLNQIGQIAVNVRDLEVAVAFYRDVLGMDFLFQVPSMAFFNCSGVRLMLTLPESADANQPASIIYYKVADIEASYAELAARGVTFSAAPGLVAKMPDHDLWMAFFDDTEGNTLALMCEQPTA